MEISGEKRGTVCVTGAGGFIASWLIKLLLSKGYTVHGTVRDPDNEKNAHLKNLEGASERLKLFRADLLDSDAYAAAIAGCEGVFHLACPVPITLVSNPQAEMVAPAVRGTLNVLKACSETRVKRVVVASSIDAVQWVPNWPQDKVADEELWSDAEYCRTIQYWYGLAKTLAERESIDYAAKNGLDVVTVCPSLTLGPLLQSTVNTSSLLLVNILTGKFESMEDTIWHIVDVRDVADALLLVYENPEASGRYICAPYPINIREWMDMLKSMYPDYKYPKEYTKGQGGPRTTTDKLKGLGWKCRQLKETLVDTIESYEKAQLFGG